jgi:UDP-N-acetyl-D-mannosaminuronate dehydrogenase
MVDKQLSVDIQMKDEVTLAYVTERTRSKSILVDNIKKGKKIIAAVTQASTPRHKRFGLQETYHH